jgi:uncharacterized protein YdhG (YjbR/CyaY superfamily)
MNTKITNIDEYIAGYPKNIQEILEQVRKAIAEVVPDAKEKISYGIPTFELSGKNLVHFGAYPKHIGFYPGGIVTMFEKELKSYKTSKGTVQFPINKPMPVDLIQKITKFRVVQILE